MKKNILIAVMAILSACAQSNKDQESAIIEPGTSKQHVMIEDLITLAKVYGYVRYFHPTDEALELNWEKFLVYSIQKVRQENNQTLQQKLVQLFQPIAPQIQIYAANTSPQKRNALDPVNGQSLKVWQHKGLGFESPALYRSTRVGDIPDEPINHVYNWFAASEYMGHQFKLTARAKADIPNSNFGGRLFLVALNDRYDVVFQDLMHGRLVTDNNWATYVIQGKFEAPMAYISVGAELLGSGQLWVDDFKLEVSTDGLFWHEVEIANHNFDEPHPKHPAKEWHTQLKGLFEFGLVNDHNNSVLKISSAQDHLPGQLFSPNMSSTQIINKPIGSGLMLQLPLAVWDEPQQELNDSFKGLQEQMTDIGLDNAYLSDVHVRLANVFKVWNVIQHFYPYFDVVDVDWHAVLSTGIQQALPEQSANEHYLGLNQMLSTIDDGHAVVMYQAEPGYGALPIRIEWVENQLVVTASDIAGVEKGDLIMAVDGLDATSYLEQAESHVSGSPHLRRLRALNQFGQGDLGSEITLKLNRNNEVVVVSHPRQAVEANLFFNAVSEFEFPDIAELEPGIFYVNLFSTSLKTFEQYKPQLAQAKGIVFDNRWDGQSSGNVKRPSKIRDVLPHLTQEPVGSAQWGVPQIMMPDREAMTFDYSDWQIEPAEPYFSGKKVIINVPSVVSAGETFMGMLDHYDLVESVGEPTAGCNGNVNYIELIGGAKAWFTGMKVLKHDNSQLHLIGYEPDYPVNKSIAAVISGEDEYLEQALAVIKKSIQ